MMCERIDAVRAVRQAAHDLSRACLHRLDLPAPIGPLVELYNKTVSEPMPERFDELLSRLPDEDGEK